MKTNAFAAKSIEELWSLHEEIGATLRDKIATEKDRLDMRLRQIQSFAAPTNQLRPYRKVLPKYQNPKNPAEKWTGRGKKPSWVAAELRAGRKLTDLLIDQAKAITLPSRPHGPLRRNDADPSRNNDEASQ